MRFWGSIPTREQHGYIEQAKLVNIVMPGHAEARQKLGGREMHNRHGDFMPKHIVE